LNIEVPEIIFKATGLSESQILHMLSLVLYDKEKLSIGYASKLANLSQAEFIELMADYGVELKYNIADLHNDIDNLKDI